MFLFVIVTTLVTIALGYIKGKYASGDYPTQRYQMKDLITNYWNKFRGKGPIQRYWEEQAPAEDDAKLCDLKYKCAEGHTQDHD